MPQKEYLTEENYVRANKKIKTISLIILICGLVIGGGLIVLGVVKTEEAKQENARLEAEASIAIEEQKAEDAKELTEAKRQKEELQAQYNAKQTECDSIPMGTSTWISETSSCSREASTIREQMANLEMTIFQLENKDYSFSEKSIQAMYTRVTSPVYFVIGGFIILICLVASLSIYLITKRRAIAAYKIQTARPLVKEGIDKAMPTATKVTEDISRSISKGIKDGLKS